MLSERIGKRKIIFLGLERLQMRIIGGFRTISCGAYRFFAVLFNLSTLCRMPHIFKILQILIKPQINANSQILSLPSPNCPICREFGN